MAFVNSSRKPSIVGLTSTQSLIARRLLKWLKATTPFKAGLWRDFNFRGIGMRLCTVQWRPDFKMCTSKHTHTLNWDTGFVFSFLFHCIYTLPRPTDFHLAVLTTNWVCGTQRRECWGEVWPGPPLRPPLPRLAGGVWGGGGQVFVATLSDWLEAESPW